ncbi:MAG TPA: MFS transporter [Candidatus Acidoferrales bacterium]|nr:MFS transporter [Candidatus Acidoferrales bacterium]
MASATRAQTGVVYAIGLVQGVALVTFPAASTIFTGVAGYRLSLAQYGAMFLPQVLTAMTAAILGGELGRRFGIKRLCVAGLVSNLISMLLLLGSSRLSSGAPATYPMLLVATAALGTGFGLTVPALNTLTGLFHPQRVDSAVLALNALLGLGSLLGPVFVAVFTGLGFWWGLPLASSVLLLGLLAVTLSLPLGGATRGSGPRSARARLPARLYVYVGLAVLYGACETMSGNWAPLDMTGKLAASPTWAALALTAFWASVTGGRILFALIQRWLPARFTYRGLPFLLAAVLLGVAFLPAGHPILALVAFSMAGLGCSALLPLTISFGQEEIAGLGTLVAGAVLGSYQLGYGIAAFGVGPLVGAGVPLPTMFGFSALLALALGVFSLAAGPGDRTPAGMKPALAAALGGGAGPNQ